MDAPAFQHRFTSAFTPRDKLVKRTVFSRPATARAPALPVQVDAALSLQPAPPPFARRPESASFSRPISSLSVRERESLASPVSPTIPTIPEVLVTIGDEDGRTVHSSRSVSRTEPSPVTAPAASFYRPLTAPIKNRSWEPLHASTSSNDGLLSRLKLAIENTATATVQSTPGNAPAVLPINAPARPESRSIMSSRQSQQHDRAPSAASNGSSRRPPSVPALSMATLNPSSAPSSSHRAASARPVTASARSTNGFKTAHDKSALSPRLTSLSTPDALRMHGVAVSHAPRATLSDLTQKPSQYQPALVLANAPAAITNNSATTSREVDLVQSALRSHSATRQYFADAQSAMGPSPSPPRDSSRLTMSRMSIGSSASPPLTARHTPVRPFSPAELTLNAAQFAISHHGDDSEGHAAQLKSVIDSATAAMATKLLHAKALVRDIKSLSAMLPESQQGFFHGIETLVSEISILNDEEQRLQDSIATTEADLQSSTSTSDAAASRLQTLRRRAADIERASDRLDAIITERTKKASENMTAQQLDITAAAAGAGTAENATEQEVIQARALPPRLMSWPLVRPHTANQAVKSAEQPIESSKSSDLQVSSVEFATPVELERAEFIQELEFLNNRPASPQGNSMHSPKAKTADAHFNRRSALSFVQTSFESMARAFSGASHLSTGPVTLRTIVEALIHSCDAERANVYVFDSNHNRLTLKATAGVQGVSANMENSTLQLSTASPSPAARAVRAALISSALSTVFRHPPSNPAAASQTLTTERSKLDSYDGLLAFHTQTALALPVYDQRHCVIGVIEVLNKRITGHKTNKTAFGSPFTRGDESILALAAAQASCVLQENRARSTLRYLKRKSTLTSHLHHILCSQTNVAHALSEVCEWLCVATDSQRCALFVIDHATDSLVLQHFSEWRDCTNSLRLRIDGLNGILSHVLDSNISRNSGKLGFVTSDMIVLADSQQMQSNRSLRPEINNHATRLLDEAETIVSTMVVPIRQEATGTLLGMAQLFNCATVQHDSAAEVQLQPGTRSYDNLDVEIAAFWSTYAAIVTEHTLLLERELATRARLSAALESVGSRLNSIDLNETPS